MYLQVTMPAGYQNIFRWTVGCSYNRDIPACGCKINIYIYTLNNINVDAIFGVAKNKNVDENRPCINSLYIHYIMSILIQITIFV